MGNFLLFSQSFVQSHKTVIQTHPSFQKQRTPCCTVASHFWQLEKVYQFNLTIVMFNLQASGPPETQPEPISECGSATKAAATPHPKRGDDHTILQALTTLDFWLLFVATIFGVGSGLTATDNMAQLGLSVGYAATNVHTFVSLLSIWNSIGRWVGGFLSDFLLFRYGFPRTEFHTLMLLVMAVAYLLLAVNVPGALYYGTVLLGLSFGTQYPVYTTIVAEEFGLKRFATLYNCLNISCSVGNYILSGPLAGMHGLLLAIC